MNLQLESGHGDTPPPTSPVKRPKKITFAIGDKSPQIKSPDSVFDFDSGLSSPVKNKLLVELFELKDGQWEEAARWIRYEEDVEGRSHHWGVPHLGLIFFDSISVLLKMVKKAVVIEIDVNGYESLIENVVETLKNVNTAPFIGKKIADLMRLKQKHVVAKSNLIKSITSTGLQKQDRLTGNPYSMPSHAFVHGSGLPLHKSTIRKHLESVAEAAQVYAAELKEAEDNTMVFIRLTNATHFPEIHEDDQKSAEGEYPSKFMVFILGPPQPVSFHQLGRCFSTMLSNESFKPFADKATTSQDLEEGVKEFLENSAVLPGTKVDSKELVLGDRICEEINSHAKMKQAPSPERRGAFAQVQPMGQMIIYEEKKKTGKFSGCLEDVRTRFPHYVSDFSDALNWLCVRSVLYMFLACITATVTFGGLMGEYTQERMGMAETVIAQGIIGIIWGLFSAQPLIIQSPTGPVLIFEGALFAVCKFAELDFLTVRLYTGYWIFLFSIIVICCDWHKILSNVTAFTEEIFSSLISVIFLYEGCKFLMRTFTYHPAKDYDSYVRARLACDNASDHLESFSINCAKLPQPNTLLFSANLLILTLILSMVFRKIRDSQWLGRKSRKILGDYSVAASLSLVLVLKETLFSDIYVENLEMPKTLNFTNPAKRGHGLFVSYYTDKPFQTGLASFLVAFLVFILVFVETGITEVTLARKERKMVKGSGKSWDILLAGFCTLLCSVFGMPWMCAAAVQSIAHADSLTKLQKAAPGERPVPVAVVEQRVTGIALSIAILVFGLFGVYIKFMPMACLFGVFAYLGITSILDLDLFQRIQLFFKPAKYHRKCPYVDEVATSRMHYYTLIQISLVVVAFLFKLFQPTAVFFPFVLCIYVFIRSKVLPYFFTKAELAALDECAENDPTEPELPLLV